jgi:hypothetical protein
MRTQATRRWELPRLGAFPMLAACLSQLVACGGGTDSAGGAPYPSICPSQDTVRANAACDLPPGLACASTMPNQDGCSATTCRCDSGRWSPPSPPSCPSPTAVLSSAPCPAASLGLMCEGDPAVCGGTGQFDWLQCQFAPGASWSWWRIVTPAPCSDAAADANASPAESGAD